MTHINGICACGENALQCPQCRNINYEVSDPFMCKECGVSRYSKFDFSFSVREGFATETIDSEDMKESAVDQIEVNLVKAQQSYS